MKRQPRRTPPCVVRSLANGWAPLLLACPTFAPFFAERTARSIGIPAGPFKPGGTALPTGLDQTVGLAFPTAAGDRSERAAMPFVRELLVPVGGLGLGRGGPSTGAL